MAVIQLDLNKGMSLDLTKIDDADQLSSVAVGVNWGQIQITKTKEVNEGGFLGFGGKKVQKEVVVRQETVDLDLSAILYDSNDNHITTIYYGRLRSTGISHSGDDRKGDDSQEDSDNETIDVNLNVLPDDVAKIVFVLVSFGGQRFGRLPYAQIKLYNTSSAKTLLADTNIDIANDGQFSDKLSMIFASLEKKNGTWSYKAICEPTTHSRLEALVTHANKY